MCERERRDRNDEDEELELWIGAKWWVAQLCLVLLCHVPRHRRGASRTSRRNWDWRCDSHDM